jgi:hypothetical protein
MTHLALLFNIRKNCLGTISFAAKFKGMRKPAEFIVYPVKSEDDAGQILIQSDTRIGYVHLDTGAVWMSKPHAGGAYQHHLRERTLIDTLSAESLFDLKAHVFATAHGDAGRAENHIIGCDNGGAINIFGAPA